MSTCPSSDLRCDSRLAAIRSEGASAWLLDGVELSQEALEDGVAVGEQGQLGVFVGLMRLRL